MLAGRGFINCFSCLLSTNLIINLVLIFPDEASLDFRNVKLLACTEDVLRDCRDAKEISEDAALLGREI